MKRVRVVRWALLGMGLVLGAHLVTAADRSQTTGVLGCRQLVSAVAETGRVALDGVFFDFNRATLRADSLSALIAARDAIRTLGGDWTIEGHTDNVGSHDYNLRLSLARAEAVTHWLRAADVGGARLDAQGFSFDRPVAANETDDGRARNRRVELAARNVGAGVKSAASNGDDTCADSAPVVADDDLTRFPGLVREAGPEWIPHAYFMGTGNTMGPQGSAFETVDLGGTGTPQMCQALCLNDAGCMTWSFEPPGSYFVATGRCQRWGSHAEVQVLRSDEPFFAGLRPEATTLAEGSAAILAEIAADETELARYAATIRMSVPSTVPPRTSFRVQVTGPAGPGDWVEIAELEDRAVPNGGLARVYAEGVNASGGAALEIEAPGPGDYVLRYVVEHPRAGRRVAVEVPLRVGAGGT